MKAQLSPLVLLDFAIINTNYSFISSDEEINLRQISGTYDIDIDFAIIPSPENTRIFIKAAINMLDEKKPGYSIFAEGVGIFQLLENPELTEEDKNSLIQYSAVSIALNSLRGFISSLTANAPFGKYVLPSIDINNLAQQKLQDINPPKKSKKKK